MENLTAEEIRSLPTTDESKSKTNGILLAYLNDKNININNNFDLKYSALDKYLLLNKEEALPKLLTIANDNQEDEYFREAIIKSLERIHTPEVEKALLIFSKHEQKLLRIASLEALAKLGVKEAWPDIIQGIIDLPDNDRKWMAESFRRGKENDWKLRSTEIINYLKASNYSSGNIDSFTLIEAMRPEEGWPRNQDHLIYFLINASIDQSPRMTQIIAKLIIECSNGSQTIAGQKIKEFEISKNVPAEKLNNLRITVGGEIALDPIINLLEINLRENFQKPISELNENTKNMWQKTIKYAQYGFIARIGMSIIVFIIGIYLLIISTWGILYGDFDQGKVLGAGVSFVTGLSMILTIVYSGPLKEIRKSVNDLGISSAAFIAYIHRVLEISHTFSFYYLKQKITFDEMKISSELIDNAMKNTVDILRIKDPKDSK